MSRTRWWTAIGIVGVLALAAGLMIWQGRSTTAPTTTSLLAAPPTTTTSIPPTTTVVVTTTSTTTQDQRTAEVEQILTDLWYGWFDAIYRKDANALWDVVATAPFHQAGTEAMGTADFVSPPQSQDLTVRVEEVLLDRPDCLVVHNTISLPFLAGDPTNTSVKVMWPDDDGRWRFATSWLYPRDLWQADCDEMTREETP